MSTFILLNCLESFQNAAFRIVMKPFHVFDFTGRVFTLEINFYYICWVLGVTSWLKCELISEESHFMGLVWWIRICLYFSAFTLPSVRTKSPTPLVDKHPQTFIASLPWLDWFLADLFEMFFIPASYILFSPGTECTFFHCWGVQFLCSPAYMNLFTLLLS